MRNGTMRSWSFLIIGAIALLGGCGAKNELNRQPISGTVTLDKEPVANGTIRFEPLEKGVAAGATISQGKYNIPAERGLPAGEYLVRISAAGATGPVEEAPGDSSKLAEELIPAKYNSNSELKVSVKVGDRNPYDFNLSK